MPGKTAFDSGRVTMRPSLVMMKAVDDEPSVTWPSSTIQASATPASGGLLRQHLRKQRDRLDVAPLPAQILDRDHRDAHLRRWRARDVLDLREHHDRRLGAGREGELALGDAARHLHVDRALDEAVAAHELLLEPRPLGRRVGIRDADLLQRAFEPGEVRVVVDEARVQHRADLVDAVGEQEAAVHDRNLRLLERHEGAVDENDARHGVFLETRPCAGRPVMMTIVRTC